MLESQEEHREESGYGRDGNRLIWLGIAAVIVAIVIFVAYGYARQARSTADTLTARESDMNSKIASLEDQLNTATQKISDMQTAQAQQEAKAQADAQAAAASRAASTKRPARRAAVDPRWKQMQSRLDAQQKQLEETNNSLNQTRSDLEGNISSTRDELNGSIAKTHDELVALEQRGERNYYEFDVSKGKGFQRTGPISVSLRKADAKHEHYDLAMMVDDNELQKKNVNLYEPILIGNSQDSPVEVVVNKIDKNHIHGYVSSAKYTQAQVTPASGPANAPELQNRAASPASAPAANPQSN
jgi:hypothetical protein